MALARPGPRALYPVRPLCELPTEGPMNTLEAVATILIVLPALLREHAMMHLSQSIRSTP